MQFVSQDDNFIVKTENMSLAYSRDVLHPAYVRFLKRFFQDPEIECDFNENIIIYKKEKYYLYFFMLANYDTLESGVEIEIEFQQQDIQNLFDFMDQNEEIINLKPELKIKDVSYYEPQLLSAEKNWIMTNPDTHMEYLEIPHYVKANNVDILVVNYNSELLIANICVVYCNSNQNPVKCKIIAPYVVSVVDIGNVDLSDVSTLVSFVHQDFDKILEKYPSLTIYKRESFYQNGLPMEVINPGQYGYNDESCLKNLSRKIFPGSRRVGCYYYRDSSKMKAAIQKVLYIF